jgi:hypothetical protein
VFLAVGFVCATEPDGRVAFRYEWIGEKADPGQPRRLRVSVTALVPLDDARLEASAPSGAEKFLTAFPLEGFQLGKFAAGGATVIELEVVEPAKGGEILTLALTAVQNGVPVREVIGIPVGTPGVAPTLRHGAVEFPAARAP